MLPRAVQLQLCERSHLQQPGGQGVQLKVTLLVGGGGRGCCLDSCGLQQGGRTGVSCRCSW